ncbi:MAG: hypothetical protein Q7S58_11490, partial [Candidatus Binatus sp.]|uniref:hypothetical protein n=1 Tax=Candidatus Binatus sp. TaxID=2811406 RepID=UPI0027230869
AFPSPPLLLSLSIASSSGTRRQAGASCGSTRRIMTLFFFSTNFATLPRHRNRSYPPAKLINEEWTLFRWIQVQLLAGLDFFASHGLGAPFNRENLFHGLLDLDYLITAVVVGGLASREKQMLERFSLLRPDGLVLK